MSTHRSAPRSRLNAGTPDVRPLSSFSPPQQRLLRALIEAGRQPLGGAGQAGRPRVAR